MKKFLMLPVVAMAFTVLVPTAQADPDLPDGSGDDCASAVDLGEGAVGSVGGDDSADWYRNSGSADEIQIDNLTVGSRIRVNVYDSDCVQIGTEWCTFGPNLPFSSECDISGRAERTVFRLADGNVRVPGIRINAPADGHIELVQHASETGAPSGYLLNRVTPELDQQL